MQTKTYAELFALIQALCGVVFASIETPRIKALINRRALRAYRASNYWTRFLKIGEERVISSSVIPYSESGLSSIDTFLRVYKQAPYISSSVQEYDIMITANGATLISGGLNPTEAFVTYKAQLSDTYGDGSGESTTIPAEWYQYIAHGTYADYLRAEGQQEKSVIADQEAELLLQDEMIRLDENHTSGLVSNRIFTNANMQMRY
tara:strand:- start:138 stop:752 length:615 start_codon:yes stop_codon:yes gene_type:complete